MLVQRARVSLRSSILAVRLNSTKANDQPLYLNPHKWEGLPADRVFELHDLRKTELGERYVPNDAEREAVLSTVAVLSKGKPPLSYVYEIDNFKNRVMNNADLMNTGAPKYSNIEVLGKGTTPHEKRKINEMHRISAYEMPLLAKFRQEYVPAEATKNPINLTFNSDLSNDASSEFNRKVTLTVRLEDLKLDEKQSKKFKILSGSKFDHNKNELKFKSSQFQDATQNARWLVERFNILLKESKDLSKETFEDIPVDTRHSKPFAHKKTPVFPEEWKRPQDAPAQKHSIVRKLVDSVKEKKDQIYISKLSP